MGSTYGGKKTMHNYYDSVDFIRTSGALHGVRLIIPRGNVKKLSNDLTSCIALAEKFHQDNVEIDVHFGKKLKKGFKLELRVHWPTERD